MTPKQRQAYLDSKGSKCPYCQSVDISAGSSDADGDEIYQKVVCNACKREWTDIFRLRDVVED